MLTLFEGIPDVFVEHYNAQFCDWARQFRTRGRRVAIVFDVMPGDIPTMDVSGNLVWSGAWLTAEMEHGWRGGGPRMVVKPATDWDRNLIEVHCWHLKRWRH